MSDLRTELEDLALADRHIAEGDRRITQQIARIACMAEQGLDTVSAQELLDLLEDTLVEWRAHRRVIIGTIERLSSTKARDVQ